MSPILISLCSRPFSGCKSINLRQAGKSQVEDNISGTTFDTGNKAGKCTSESSHPPRDNFQLDYTEAQRVLSRVEPYGVTLFLHKPLLAFFPFLPSHTTPFLQCASWDPFTHKNLLAPKFSSEGLLLREPQLNQTLASEMQGSGHTRVLPIIGDPIWRKKWGRREAIYSKSRVQFRNKVERESLKVGFVLKLSMGSYPQNSKVFALEISKPSISMVLVKTPCPRCQSHEIVESCLGWCLLLLWETSHKPSAGAERTSSQTRQFCNTDGFLWKSSTNTFLSLGNFNRRLFFSAS